LYQLEKASISETAAPAGRIPTAMTSPASLAFVLLAAPALLPAQAAPDPRALIEQSLKANNRSEELARDYTYIETVVEREFSGGKVSKVETTQFEILNLYGQPYRRLIARDNKPLPPDEERKQARKFEETASERASETPAEREKRIAKYRERAQRQRNMLNEIPHAYDLSLAGETTWNGTDAWLIQGTPRKGYKPKDSNAARLFPNIKGLFYISKNSPTLLKIEAEAIDTVSFGLVVARMDKGARFQIERTRLDDSLWATSRVRITFDARIALVKHMKMDIDISYTNHRKFQTDSRIVSTSQ
jgi:hypothetical protein